MNAKETRPKGVFITGTDTEVGKTAVSAGLMVALTAKGVSVAGLKPVSAGCRETPEGRRNEDAETLLSLSTVPLTYDEVNPVAFSPAIAPHLAAIEEDRPMRLEHLTAACRAVVGRADMTVVEGAGGWLVPINAQHTLADLALALELPIVLVVGIRLGCLNHAMLSAELIEHQGGRLLGWVANILVDESSRPQANIETLIHRLPAPLLATIPRLSTPSVAEFGQGMAETAAILAEQANARPEPKKLS